MILPGLDDFRSHLLTQLSKYADYLGQFQGRSLSEINPPYGLDKNDLDLFNACKNDEILKSLTIGECLANDSGLKVISFTDEWGNVGISVYGTEPGDSKDAEADISHHKWDDSEQARYLYNFFNRLIEKYPNCDFYLFGHSLGGYLVMWLLKKFDKNVRIKKLYLFNTDTTNYTDDLTEDQELRIHSDRRFLDELKNFDHAGDNIAKIEEISQANTYDWGIVLDQSTNHGFQEVEKERQNYDSNYYNKLQDGSELRIDCDSVLSMSSYFRFHLENIARLVNEIQNNLTKSVNYFDMNYRESVREDNSFAKECLNKATTDIGDIGFKIKEIHSHLKSLSRFCDAYEDTVRLMDECESQIRGIWGV